MNSRKQQAVRLHERTEECAQHNAHHFLGRVQNDREQPHRRGEAPDSCEGDLGKGAAPSQSHTETAAVCHDVVAALHATVEAFEGVGPNTVKKESIKIG